LNDRVANSTEEPSNIKQQISSQEIEQTEEYRESNKYIGDFTKQEDQSGRRNTSIFLRIWFGLKNRDLVKIVIGSFAAAFSGISKPVFGFSIITIGVAYTKKDAKREVGWYSIIFSLIGLLSLFSHTMQHYFFGMVGEKAMINLKQALYSGIQYSHQNFCFIKLHFSLW
jgi:ATP-binding cassette subfamily B (MDR/TAP) protein 1